MTAATRRFGIEEAGRALGVSTATVWRMIRRGELPTVRERGRRLVLAEGLADRARRRTRRDLPPLTRDHPIFRLVGAGRGGGRTPGARDKHALLDE
ncbi:MAG TPA: helix-turn-helix domain-containing protein [Methylomirabilota bacterium]|nr:helix-turn-helix domain-containing protein [Methylomirabilota bacterium]